MLKELAECVAFNAVFDRLVDNNPEAEELRGKIDAFLPEIEAKCGRKHMMKLDSAINDYAAEVQLHAVRCTLQWIHLLLTGQPAGPEAENNTLEVKR